MKILAAMSGGVDSSVAAALLAQAGHEVTGVHLKLLSSPAMDRMAGRGCCSLADADDARRVAEKLGIPFYVWDLCDIFRDAVLEPFVEAYAQGETPNPCLRCNEHVKFRALLDRALSLGFDALATGHYVRLSREARRIRLHKAIDLAKDQSYVVYMLGQSQLANVLFPLGDLTKEQTRREAARLGLRVAAKPDSYEICFIPDGETAAFLESRLGKAPGDIVDCEGRVLGRHDGAYRFTLGQRRGLGVGGGRRRYVVEVDPASRRVVLGTRSDLGRHEVGVCGVSLVSGEAPVESRVWVRLRAHAPESEASLALGGDEAVLRFEQAQHGVARGQAAVFYRGDELLGGGTIAWSK
ncbi:MAG: tRNA 2-thiouridine(34) synthase MnmA [Actinomycetota bacterium]